MSLSGMMLLLFVGGLAGLLPFTRLLVILAGISLLAFELLRHRRSALAALGSVPLGMLILLALLFWLLLGDAHFRFYDEYSHWGIHLKEMLALGGYWDADSNSLHPRYPPGATLWQFLAFFSGEFRDGRAYFAQFLLLFVPLLVLYEGLRWRQVISITGITVLLVLLLASFGHGIASLYVDHVLGTWFAGIVVAYLLGLGSDGIRQRLAWCLPLIALALIKDVGFFFALAVAGLFALLIWIRPPGSERGAARLRLPALLFAAWIAGPALVAFAWSLDRDASAAPTDVMSVSGLVGIVTGNTHIDDPERAAIVNEHFVAMFSQHPLGKNEKSYQFNESSFDTMAELASGRRLTTASFLLLYCLWSLAMLLLIIPREARPVWAATLGGVLAIALAYIGMLYLSYQFVFPRRDALAIASYVRYVHSVVLALFILATAPLLPATNTSFGQAERRTLPRFALPATLAALIAVLLLVERPYLTPLYRPASMPTFRADIQPFVAEVRALVGRKRLWVFFPDPNEHLLLSSILLHELTPTPATISRDPAFLARPAAVVLAELAAYDYAWVLLQDEVTQSSLAGISDGLSPIGLYEVSKSNGQIRLLALGPDGRPMTR